LLDGSTGRRSGAQRQPRGAPSRLPEIMTTWSGGSRRLSWTARIRESWRPSTQALGNASERGLRWLGRDRPQPGWPSGRLSASRARVPSKVRAWSGGRPRTAPRSTAVASDLANADWEQVADTSRRRRSGRRHASWRLVW